MDVTIRILIITFINTGMCLAMLKSPPNIILILADDMGYGDLASYGHPTQELGPLDVFGSKGLRFIQGYSADSICSPSRASLLTGRLPVRTGAWGEKKRVWLPNANRGLPHWEVTIAEALKQQGYATGMVGKWHLGINSYSSNDFSYFPSTQGFDFVGHMLPFGGAHRCANREGQSSPKLGFCALCYGDEIIQQPFYYENLTVKMVDDSQNFIRSNADGPFFFFYSAIHPHVPMYSSQRFKNSSKRGLYGDVINELAWAVESIVNEVHEQGIENNTLIVFTSDHGPHVEQCIEGGSPGIFRGGKSNSFEGGYRVPLIAYWPNVIEPGVSEEIFSALDFFPTFLSLAGADMPNDRKFDGIENTGILLGNSTHNARDFIPYVNRDVLFAVRYGRYKIHYYTQDDKPPQYFGRLCKPPGYRTAHYLHCPGKNVSEECIEQHDPPLMFDLYADPTESVPLNTTRHADILNEIGGLVERFLDDIDRHPPLMDHRHDWADPCCNRATGCICNWP